MCPPADNNRAVVVVDPLSTGATISARIVDRGYEVIRLWSSDCPADLRTHTSPDAKDCFAVTLEHDGGMGVDALEVTAQALHKLPYHIEAIICGSEPGVTLTDALAEHMGMRGNGTELGHVRRHKFNQSEAVRAAGQRAVRQVLAKSVYEACAFVTDFPQPFRAIVKPVESAGSEDVHLCHSVEDVAKHVGAVLGKVNALGAVNEAVLVQEFLAGTEYIVDFVSRDGVHKCTAVWAYDKRPANGGSFVYFGQRPLSIESAVARDLIQYTRRVIEALGIRNGATHSEVIVDAEGSPCLVECNCRAQGGNGEWVPVIEPLSGYSQVSALIDAFLDGPAFDALPSEPQPFNGFGMLCFLVSYKEGTLVSSPGMTQLRQLRSHLGSALEVKEGARLVKTINVFTELGMATLLHEDPEAVEADYVRLHELCLDDNFLTVEEDGPEVSAAEGKAPGPESISDVALSRDPTHLEYELVSTLPQ